MKKNEKELIKMLKHKRLITLQIEKTNEKGEKEVSPVVADNTSGEICFAISLSQDEYKLFRSVISNA